MAKQGRPNHLIDEKSPYLLEHAYNPVDWYPWGSAAFEKAKAEDKPIFLSIGYSTCHWCHRFATESFEDEKIAALMNDRFVSIKVDREERPDLDEIYMKAVTTLTGQGGWPLSAFLTPDLKPFYGGTYFPPVSGRGLPAFPEVLKFIADTWKNRRQDVLQSSDEITKIIREGYERKGEGSLSKTLLDNAYAVIVAGHDSQFGGFGRAPKFPMPSYLGFLLRYHSRTRKDAALNPVVKTLDAMANGGIHDHLGGGFHRYSTDRYWLIPHFEKMLYDNAILAKCYLDAYRVTRLEKYAATARDTLDWMTREMASSEGGFYSAQDADTPDGEGYYYSWTPAEVSKVLGEESAAALCEYFGITPEGNFDGRTVLSISGSVEKTAQKLGVEVGQVVRTIEDGKKALLKARRDGRNRPAVDDKILSSWNGLAVSAFANASQALQEERYLDAADRCAEFILAKLVKDDGRLYRRYRDGDVAIDGNLEDYSFLIAGLIDLYEASFDEKWVAASVALAEKMVELLWDGKGSGGFFLTPPGAELAAIKEGYDGPTPSGNSVAALDLLRLAEFTGRQAFRDKAEKTLRLFAEDMESTPSGYTEMLGAVDFSLGSREIVVAAPKGTRAADTMVMEIQRRFLPTKILAMTSGEKGSIMAPLTEGKASLKGVPTVYICENFSCKAPVTDVSALRAQLDAWPDEVAGEKAA
ncbi:MAG: thioredoxin domain-containing protein [Thaumarchaeota archaeon]|nr:thioredoxin domain-containing protein [Nitrososphaerota archaeon]